MSTLKDPILIYMDIHTSGTHIKVTRKRVHSKAYHDCFDQCFKVMKMTEEKSRLQAGMYATKHTARWEKLVNNIDVD